MQLKDLRANPKNPRKISDEKLKQLKKALLEFGDLSGIVYNTRTKQLVGGHQRSRILDAASVIEIQKKYKKPTSTGTVGEGYVIVRGERYSYREVNWDEMREKAANLAANKNAGEWDLPQLKDWLKDLNSFDADFDLSLTMFDEDELQKFGGIKVSEHTRTGPTGVDEDEIPEKVPAKTKLGDIYMLGSHRLFCGDSTDILQVEKLMNGDKADMVFTDPPYGMNLDTDYTKKFENGFRARHKHKKVEGDDKEFDFLTSYALVESIQEQFWFGADYYSKELPKNGSWIVWDKAVTESFDKIIGSAFELCWSKQKHKRDIARVVWKGVFGHNKKDDGDTKVHPTMKPVKLIGWFFEKFKGDKVIDLFGGSGSTLIACEKTNRKCFMMEIDPHYCDVIVTRWEKYTGKKAILLAKKQTVIKRAKKSK